MAPTRHNQWIILNSLLNGSSRAGKINEERHLGQSKPEYIRHRMWTQTCPTSPCDLPHRPFTKQFQSGKSGLQTTPGHNGLLQEKLISPSARSLDTSSTLRAPDDRVRPVLKASVAQGDGKETCGEAQHPTPISDIRHTEYILLRSKAGVRGSIDESQS